MLKNKISFVGCAVSILLTATFMSSTALANSDNAWEIKQFTSQNNQFLPYCTLSHKYGNTVFAVAKNEDGMSNIAIESTKPLLKDISSGNITATIETDFIKKDVNITPVTKSAFMIKLTEPNEIDALLKDITNISISSEKLSRNLNFTVININKATTKLAECLDSFKKPAQEVTENIEPAKDARLLEEITKKDIEIKELKKALARQQQQLETAPLYKQAQRSDSFKNLNIAHLDRELIKKQEDLERQAKGLTEQQEWIEKERLRVKKLRSLDATSEELLKAQQKIAELEKNYKLAQEKLNKMQAELALAKQNKPASNIQNPKTIKPNNITWDKTVENKTDILTTMPPKTISSSDTEKFSIPKHVPISKRIQKPSEHIEKIVLSEPVIDNNKEQNAEQILLDRATSIHKEQKQLANIPSSHTTHAPIKLTPPVGQRIQYPIVDKTTVISAEDTLPNNDIRNILQINNNTQASNAVTSFNNNQHKTITLKAPVATPQIDRPKKIIIDKTYVIEGTEPENNINNNQAVKLIPPKEPEIIHLSAPAGIVEPKAGIKQIETTYIIEAEEMAPAPKPELKPIKLIPPQISSNEMVHISPATDNVDTTYITADTTIASNDTQVEPIKLIPPSSYMDKNNLKPMPFSENTELQEKEIEPLPEPVASFASKDNVTLKPVDNKASDDNVSKQSTSSPYEELLEDVMQIHRKAK